MNLIEYVLQRLVVQVVQGNPNEVHKALTVWSVSCAMPFAHRLFSMAVIAHAIPTVGCFALPTVGHSPNVLEVA